MNVETGNWVWTVVILPLVILSLKQEIKNFLTSWKIYRKRHFDLDGDPTTSDAAQVLNGATGEWIDVQVIISITGARVEYPDGGVEWLHLPDWDNPAIIRKRRPPSK